MNPDETHLPEDNTPETTAPEGESRAGAYAALVLVVLMVVAGVWLAIRLRQREPHTWGGVARSAMRTREHLAASPGDADFRSRFAHELLELATLSPQPLAWYLDARAQAHCEQVLESTPPGSHGFCRQLKLERLLLRRKGADLMRAAEAELAGAPRSWLAPLHRYAGEGAIIEGQWDQVREHYGAAFTVDGSARDALRTGWASLHVAAPALALEWLDKAFEANGGYPSPYRAVIAASPMRETERQAMLADIDAEAAFYDACRAAAHAMLAGDTVPVPAWPEPAAVAASSS